MQFAAMHGDMKMVATGGNRPELFNVELDPAERRNIAAEHADELKSMTDGLHVNGSKPKPTRRSRKRSRRRLARRPAHPRPATRARDLAAVW